MTSEITLDSSVAEKSGQWPMRLLIALALLKVLALVAFGPFEQSDTRDYRIATDIVFETTEWMTDAGLDDHPFPPTIFRTISYPVLLGVTERVFGSQAAGDYAVVIMQIALSLVATFWVYQLGLQLLKSGRLALVAAAGYALSVAFVYDQHILTDSLFNSFFTVAVCWPITRLLQKRTPKMGELFLMGVALAGACAIRGIGLYFALLILPVIAYWLIRSSDRTLINSLSRAVIYVIMPMMVVGGTMAWNQMRSGYFVYTTGSQFVLIQSLMIIGKRGTNVFTTDQLIDQVAREKITDYSYTNVQATTVALFHEHGINAVESSGLHTRKFLQVFADHPHLLLYHGIREYEESIVNQFFNVADNLRGYLKFAIGWRDYSGIDDAWDDFWEQPNLTDLGYLVLLPPFRIFAWFCLVVFILGPPLIVGARWARKRFENNDENLAVLFLWALYFSYVFGLCMVHMVDRFVPAVLAAGLIPVLYTLKLIGTTRYVSKKAVGP